MQPPDAKLSDPQHVILIGGSVRSAAQSARYAGYRVTGIDFFGDIDTRFACERYTAVNRLADASDSTLRTYLKSVPPGPIVQVGGLSEAGQNLVDRLAEYRDLLNDYTHVADHARDSGLLPEAAKAAGIQFPETRRQREPSCEGFAKKSDRWLSKRDSSWASGGLGVYWAKEATLSRLTSESGTSESDWLLQQWIPGRLHGVSYYSDGRQTVLLGTCRSSFTRIGNLHFVYAGSTGPIPTGSHVQGRLQRLGQSIANHCQLRGLFNADVVIDRDQEVWLLEVNPRWSGSSELIEQSWIRSRIEIPGGSLMGAYLREVSAEQMQTLADSTHPRARIFWKRVVFASQTGRLDHHSLPLSSRDVMGQHDIRGVRYRLADLPDHDHQIRRHTPIASVFVTLGDGESRTAFVHPQRIRGLVTAVRQAVR